MEHTIAQWHAIIKKWQGLEVDIVYHPHSSYRMVKEGNACIRGVYDNFFEVEIRTSLYGNYRTTISYIDLYTHACKISLHEEEIKEKE